MPIAPDMRGGCVVEVSPRRAAITALAGAMCIAGSAVLMRLAGSSASATALFRCLFALPVLGALVLLERRRGVPPMPVRSRWMARLSGAFLAGDLILWSHSISAIGAGLATVIGNLQVLIVAGLAWWLLSERPSRSFALALPLMLAGIVAVAGVGGSHSYGSNPVLGAVFGVGTAFLYAAFILLLRQATAAPDGRGAAGTVAQPLYEATLGTAVASLVFGLFLHDLRIGPLWPALGWLALLALSSQVIGWLLITVSMPRVPAGLVSGLLLLQPIGAVALSAVILGERPSAEQLSGVALILLGVLVAARDGTRRQEPAGTLPAQAPAGTAVQDPLVG